MIAEKDSESAPVTICLADFGAEPDSGRDALPAMRLAIEAAAVIAGPVVLECPKGVYDFYPEQATRAPYYISNTASEEENADVTKTIGILLKSIANLTLEGHGSMFLIHGRMTMLVLDDCDDIEIRHVHLDYARPTVAEMTIMASSDYFMDVEVHPDSRYEFQDGKFYWSGEGWRFNEGPMQEYDPVRNKTWRIDNLTALAVRVEELAPMRLRFHYDHAPGMTTGRVLQVRDGLRDQVGAFIHRSRNVQWIKSGIHFMHGLGIVCQYSENLRFAELDLTPRLETGRTVAAFADFIHFSGCRGKVEIAGSRFVGGHDDPINVHGTHLQVTEAPKPDKIVVRFMHPQSYGFDAFFPGDEVDFIESASLQSRGTGTVRSVERLSPREILLTLAEAVPAGTGAGDAVENATWTPEVHVHDNYFARIPTRGVLATTRRKVLIERNVFDRLTMSGVFVANDAESWYESGPVRDLTIRGNRFIACGGAEHPVIYIAPENREIDADNPVHAGIVIENNVIETTTAAALDAKSVRGLRFVNNSIASPCEAHEGAAQGVDRQPAAESLIRLQACSEVTIAGNAIAPQDIPEAAVRMLQMAREQLNMDENEMKALRIR
ncbi:right-handed parallel beta-helix repeat-containing protein [Paenibacillus sp. R14(2021)]|uniref:right-handed parallel beta-helix repeat-containing protein n=1 Tax=Paenibacillus sp. R14(2021) TaxID=2859228 RepID=UPI001C616B87|nr:right-handed parallel beta-helix repeat-containing protein [Paenibacillus sp. R14(2021)]